MNLRTSVPKSKLRVLILSILQDIHPEKGLCLIMKITIAHNSLLCWGWVSVCCKTKGSRFFSSFSVIQALTCLNISAHLTGGHFNPHFGNSTPLCSQSFQLLLFFFLFLFNPEMFYISFIATGWKEFKEKLPQYSPCCPGCQKLLFFDSSLFFPLWNCEESVTDVWKWGVP